MEARRSGRRRPAPARGARSAARCRARGGQDRRRRRACVLAPRRASRRPARTARRRRRSRGSAPRGARPARSTSATPVRSVGTATIVRHSAGTPARPLEPRQERWARRRSSRARLSSATARSDAGISASTATARAAPRRRHGAPARCRAAPRGSAAREQRRASQIAGRRGVDEARAAAGAPRRVEAHRALEFAPAAVHEIEPRVGRARRASGGPLGAPAARASARARDVEFRAPDPRASASIAWR